MTGAADEPPPARRALEDPPEFRRARPWDRFPADTEPGYQVWVVDQAMAPIRVIGWTSIAIWPALPVVVWLALGHDTPGRLWLAGLVLIPAFLLSWLMLLRTSWGRARAVPIAAVTNLLVSAATLWVVADVSTSAIAVTVIFFSMLCPPVLLPFRTTALIATVLNAAGIVLTARGAGPDPTTFARDWPTYTFMLTTIVLVTGIGFVAENGLRRTYLQEQVISRQRDRLIENRRLIRRYVPPGVVEQIEAGNASGIDVPVRRRVTILFSDVVGFTSMADRLDPESLTQVINEYLGAVAEIVETHGGTLNEFAGDGFMAVFGAPAEMEPSAQVLGAIAAARAIHARLPSLNESWFRLGIDQPVLTRVGINTGVLSVGTFGSEGRATYTAIGLQTNIAARIQAECTPGGILLSQTSWHLAKDQVPCASRGEVSVKGVHFPIALYEPVAEVDPVARVDT